MFRNVQLMSDVHVPMERVVTHFIGQLFLSDKQFDWGGNKMNLYPQ
jgi:hypothetical protein